MLSNIYQRNKNVYLSAYVLDFDDYSSRGIVIIQLYSRKRFLGYPTVQVIMFTKNCILLIFAENTISEYLVGKILH